MNRTLWPKTKFAATGSIDGQLDHIFSEIEEAAEVDFILDDSDLLKDMTWILKMLPLLRELADVQASIETLWHVLDRVFGEGFSEAMVLGWVEEKNRRRGYYLEDIQ